MFPAIGEKLADFLFPPFCVACGRAGDWWCQDCRDGCQRLSGEVCPRCLTIISRGHPSPSGSSDGHECRGALPFHRVTGLGYYHDPKLRPAITALKFQGVTASRPSFEFFLRSRLAEQDLIVEGGAVLVPMPLSDKRLKERGFNQAALIAEVCLSVFPSLQIADCLERVGHRDAQSSMAHDLAARSSNILGCFRAGGQVPQHVVLVDDVVTTGATAAEAASALSAAGAESVSVFCLAIGS